jgi:hypothetical protein
MRKEIKFGIHTHCWNDIFAVTVFFIWGKRRITKFIDVFREEEIDQDINIYS